MGKVIRKKRVVIVDDSRTMQALLEHAFLARKIFQVVGVASDAASAADIIRDTVPDLVTIDLCMPYIDGAALLEMIGDMRAVCKLVVSDKATSNAALGARLQALGASACLSKTLLGQNSDQFFAKIDAACRLHDMELGRRPEAAVSAGQPPETVMSNVVAMADFGYPIPVDEAQRLRVMERKSLANLLRERQFDLITKYVAEATGYPICGMTFIDADTAWMKSAHGLDVGSVPRAMAICSYAIAQTDAFVIRDASRDARFAQVPSVAGGPKIRTYVGQPVVGRDGTRLGVLCLLDQQVRTVTRDTTRQLAAMAEIVAEVLEHRPAMAA